MPPPFCCLYGPDFQREGKTAVSALFQLEEKSAVSAVFERVLQFSAVVPCGMIHCRKLASLRSKTSPYMRRKIMFLQTADFQQFLNHDFSIGDHRIYGRFFAPQRLRRQNGAKTFLRA